MTEEDNKHIRRVLRSKNISISDVRCSGDTKTFDKPFSIVNTDLLSLKTKPDNAQNLAIVVI